MKEKKKKNEAHQKGKTNGPQGETKKKRTDPPALSERALQPTPTHCPPPPPPTPCGRGAPANADCDTSAASAHHHPHRHPPPTSQTVAYVWRQYKRRSIPVQEFSIIHSTAAAAVSSAPRIGWLIDNRLFFRSFSLPSAPSAASPEEAASPESGATFLLSFNSRRSDDRRWRSFFCGPTADRPAGAVLSFGLGG